MAMALATATAATGWELQTWQPHSACIVLTLFSHGIFHAALYKCVQIEIKRQFQSNTDNNNNTMRVRVCDSDAEVVSRQRCWRRNFIQSATRASAEQTSIVTCAYSHGRPLTTIASPASEQPRQAGRHEVIQSETRAAAERTYIVTCAYSHGRLPPTVTSPASEQSTNEVSVASQANKKC